MRRCQLIQVLLNCDLSPNEPGFHGGSALFAAIQSNAPASIVETLLRGGADVMAIMSPVRGAGWSILHSAAFNDSDQETMDVLIRAGADLDYRLPNVSSDRHYFEEVTTKIELTNCIIYSYAKTVR